MFRELITIKYPTMESLSLPRNRAKVHTALQSERGRLKLYIIITIIFDLFAIYV